MKWKRPVLFLTMLIALPFLFLASASWAQNKQADDMQLVLEKARADKKLLVAENMQLTAAEEKAFWPVYERYQDELFLLRTRTVQLIKDYADAYATMNDATAKRLLDEYMAIEGLRLKLRKAYLPKFGKVLPGVKVLRYYQIENKINIAIDYEIAARIPLVKTEEKQGGQS